MGVLVGGLSVGVSARRRSVPAAVSAALLAAVPVLVGASGCSEAEPASRAAGTGGAAASTVAAEDPAGRVAAKADDRLFVRRMVAHTRQGIVLAHLAATRARGADVRALARELERAQRSRMAVLARLPAGKAGGSGEQPDDADEFPGLVATDDVRALPATPAADFDWTFLTLMIEHHQGAVSLAGQQRREGRDPAVVAAAGRIATDEAGEIAAMRRTFGQS